MEPKNANAAAETAINDEAERAQPKGVAAAMVFLRQEDPDAQVMWETRGPRHSHIENVSQVMCEIYGTRRMMVVLSYASGQFKVFGEVAEKDPAKLVGKLTEMYA